MKTPKEIKRRIKDIRYRYIQKRFKKFLSRQPENCLYNFRQPLPGENTTIGLCMPKQQTDLNEVEWQGIICEHKKDAENCPRFKYCTSKKELVKKIDEEIQNPEICKVFYREIFELKWILEEEIKISFFSRIFSKISFFSKISLFSKISSLFKKKSK